MLISFTNSDGDTFPIQGNYILSPNWSGFGELPVIDQLVKAPYQDGATCLDTLSEPRVLTVEFAITGSTRQLVFDRRKNVATYFNPKLGIGILKWQQEESGKEYWIDCFVKAISYPSGQGQSHSHQMTIIQFIAPNPFWYDPDYIERYLVGFDGGLSFPFSFPIDFGEVGTEITVTNSGDVKTPVTIYFQGEIEDPVLRNDTEGKSIEIIKTIDDGDTLIINTAYGSRSVQILSGGSYSNAFEYVDPDSEFWQLAPGDNEISYTASSEGENAQGRLLYYNRFSGV